jgi:hypothetical protein
MVRTAAIAHWQMISIPNMLHVGVTGAEEQSPDAPKGGDDSRAAARRAVWLRSCYAQDLTGDGVPSDWAERVVATVWSGIAAGSVSAD